MALLSYSRTFSQGAHFTFFTNFNRENKHIKMKIAIHVCVRWSWLPAYLIVKISTREKKIPLYGRVRITLRCTIMLLW